MEEQYLYQADFSKSGKEMLIDLINWGNRSTMLKPLNPATTWFTRPVKLPEGRACNTAIRFDKVNGYRDMEFPQNIEYNRVDIDQIAKMLYFSFYLELDSLTKYKTTHDLLEPLFNVLKIKLLPEDVIDEPLGELKVVEPEVRLESDELFVDNLIYPKVTLRISNDSIAYLGKLTFEVRPRPIRLDTAIRNLTFTHSFQPVHGWGMG